jgi:hypothetical protein
MARGFGQTDIARDNGLKYTLCEMTTNFFANLMGEIISAIEHRQQNSMQKQGWIELPLDEINGPG